MDPNLRIVQSLRVDHHHSDGTWSPMEPAHHGQPEHDSERGWLKGLIFRCNSCQEEVRVTQGADDEGGPEERR